MVDDDVVRGLKRESEHSFPHLSCNVFSTYEAHQFRSQKAFVVRLNTGCLARRRPHISPGLCLFKVQRSYTFRKDIKLATLEDLSLAAKGKRKKKIQGGNPSKRHRDRLNTELDNLAKLLPFPEETISKLDKISILRLTVSYLKAKSYFQVCATKQGNHGVDHDDVSREFEENGVFSQLLLEALDGFIMIITTDGQLFYVSESVKDFLGYSQATLIHQSLFKFLHIDDHKTVRENLAWNEPRDFTEGRKMNQVRLKNNLMMLSLRQNVKKILHVV
ncbi:aryl hydrocarbon receptor-like [Xenia sp. Carnegie-2017]|uniref:aryl hydrocarbon receptor-like n=1 Tax=Xenia sp. Carnegie-2017 TaxID=2897299 RepID=UPI001F0459A4|nr:aryl hydrocarbon receptor-like [Xenia sp. Carnegie-2017]